MTERVRRYVCEEALRFGVTAGAIMSRDCTAATAMARSAVMCRLRADGFTVNQIGRWIGRDHSTVSHATRRISG